MADYITVAGLKSYARKEAGAGDDTFLLGVCGAASQAVRDYCQRSFDVAGNATARVFVPSGSAVLRIHDCTSVSSITEDGTTLASTYWQAEPLNSVDWTGQAKPVEQVRRIDGGVWSQTSSYPGKASVSVTAAWGWAATPDNVIEATRIVAREILTEQNMTAGYVAIGDIAARAAHSRKVAVLLDPLRRVEAFGIA